MVSEVVKSFKFPGSSFSETDSPQGDVKVRTDERILSFGANKECRLFLRKSSCVHSDVIRSKCVRSMLG